MLVRKFPDVRETRDRDRGFTLLELVVAATILAILTMMTLPLARVTIQREKEKQLQSSRYNGISINVGPSLENPSFSAFANASSDVTRVPGTPIPFAS